MHSRQPFKKGCLEMPEPYEVKVSSTVLRGCKLPDVRPVKVDK